MFSKILIANRGEIALRIIRACKEMGIETVAVYSEADENSLPVALADERVCIGAASVSESYLNKKNIIAAAEITGAEAIHPGYGFLSENADFADECEKNGIVFIGPSSKIMRLMGDKENARSTMQKIGVPVAPGTGILKKSDDPAALAADIGYPLLVKAAAGGGGKGIRLVNCESELLPAVSSASAEAKGAFGDGSVFLEKYLTDVRHVEMQIIADSYGNVVCLGERDCSLQKKKQKVLEEAPCPSLSEDLRRKMMDCAVRIVRETSYTNVGTVEFLLTPDGEFYFMEMNTRLQVEHPITEETSGIDLVKWQIRTAAKMPLSFKQEDLQLKGCSLECRITAKTTGTITFFHGPGGARVRFDSALVDGMTVLPYYDPLLGKLIVFAETREEAVRKMETALCEIAIEGIETNINDLLTLVRSPGFVSGAYNTAYIAELEDDSEK